jgi:hypothetical protein
MFVDWFCAVWDWFWKPENLTAISTLVIAGFTIVLAWVGYCQARLIRKSIDLARDEFLSTHRPEVRIKHVWLLNEALHYDEAVRVRVVCVNTGRTTATISDYSIEFVVVKPGRLLPVDPKLTAINANQFALASGISLPLPDVSYDLTEADEIAVRRQGAQLYCLGVVHYLDSVKRIRTTAFCRVYQMPDSPLISMGRFVTVNNSDYEYQD